MARQRQNLFSEMSETSGRLPSCSKRCPSFGPVFFERADIQEETEGNPQDRLGASALEGSFGDVTNSFLHALQNCSHKWCFSCGLAIPFCGSRFSWWVAVCMTRHDTRWTFIYTVGKEIVILSWIAQEKASYNCNSTGV